MTTTTTTLTEASASEPSDDPTELSPKDRARALAELHRAGVMAAVRICLSDLLAIEPLGPTELRRVEQIAAAAIGLVQAIEPTYQAGRRRAGWGTQIAGPSYVGAPGYDVVAPAGDLEVEQAMGLGQAALPNAETFGARILRDLLPALTEAMRHSRALDAKEDGDAVADPVALVEAIAAARTAGLPDVERTLLDALAVAMPTKKSAGPNGSAHAILPPNGQGATGQGAANMLSTDGGMSS